MNENPKPKGVLLVKGTYTFGCTHRHADGSVEEVPPKFEAREDGGSVAVFRIDLETMQTEPCDNLFGDYDVSGYLGEAYRLLSPSRRPDIPDLVNLLQKAGAEGVTCPFAELCTGCYSDCKFREWMEEGEEKQKSEG